MDALGIVYPQYWLNEHYNSNFDKYIKVLKEQYGHSKHFNTAAFLEGTLPLILSPLNLDLQANLFKNYMKENTSKMLRKPVTINPLTRLWQYLDANSHLRHSLSEYIIIAEIAIVMVMGSVQGERTFNMVSFMKSKLRNRLSKYLSMAVGFKSQKFSTLEDFLYNAAYDSWRAETKRHCDTK
jgi:hypothetical protein